MSLRILHLADLHLERPFAQLGCYGEVARRRRAGLRDALVRAGDEAMRHGCAVITLGGDVYEAQQAGPDTARFLSDLFATWRPLRVVIAPGNHDPFMPGSLYARTDWPDNVHIFSEPELRPLPLGDGVVLWGLAHREPAWMGDPLAGDEVGAEGGVHIALFHGAELGSRPDGKSIHGPFRAADVGRRGFTLALCGHYHRRRIDNAARVVYPGSPEPLTFDEDGERGPVIVEVGARGRVRVDALATNRWHAVRADCELDGSTTTSAVADRVRATARTALGRLPPDTSTLRMTLRGEVPAEVAVDVNAVEVAALDACGAAVVRIRDLTTVAVDVAGAVQERTARGLFARELLGAIAAAGDAGGERAMLEDALRYGLQALDGTEVGLREGSAP
jgi:DNA repair exonuclease SbcCD nuclease subunit